MHILSAHKNRVARLEEAMDQMFSLHEELYATWREIVELVEGEGPERLPLIQSRHEHTMELARKIGGLRREAFGGLTHEADLILSSRAESSWEDSIAGEGPSLPDSQERG